MSLRSQSSSMGSSRSIAAHSTRNWSISPKSRCSKARRVDFMVVTPSAVRSSSPARNQPTNLRAVHGRHRQRVRLNSAQGISGPMSETVKFRLSGSYRDTDGYLPQYISQRRCRSGKRLRSAVICCLKQRQWLDRRSARHRSARLETQALYYNIVNDVNDTSCRSGSITRHQQPRHL